MSHGQNSNPPPLLSIVQVTLKVPHVIYSTQSEGIHPVGRTPRRTTSLQTKDTLPAGHSFEGRLTGVLRAYNQTFYYQVTDLKGREWHLDSQVAKVEPVREPVGSGGAS